MIKLSILICSVTSRASNFLPNLIKQLEQQLTDEVELIVLMDNKKITIGDKRNKLMNLANGEYVVFIDDDDRISNDYVSSLLDEIPKGADVITFNAEYIHNGQWSRPVKYMLGIPKDYDAPDCYYRLPNGLSCWKRENVLGMYDDISWQEDSNFAKTMSKFFHNEIHIDKTLYFYEYNDNTTESR